MVVLFGFMLDIHNEVPYVSFIDENYLRRSGQKPTLP
jgi:hypothetical protein